MRRERLEDADGLACGSSRSEELRRQHLRDQVGVDPPDDEARVRRGRGASGRRSATAGTGRGNAAASPAGAPDACRALGSRLATASAASRSTSGLPSAISWICGEDVRRRLEPGEQAVGARGVETLSSIRHPMRSVDAVERVAPSGRDDRQWLQPAVAQLVEAVEQPLRVRLAAAPEHLQRVEQDQDRPARTRPTARRERATGRRGCARVARPSRRGRVEPSAPAAASRAWRRRRRCVAELRRDLTADLHRQPDPVLDVEPARGRSRAGRRSMAVVA